MRKWFFHLFGFLFSFLFFSWLTDIVAKYSRGFVTVYWWGVAKDICGLENPLPMQNKTLNLKTMKWLFKRPQKAPALSSWDSPMGITRTAAYFFFCWDFLYQWETSWSSGAWKYSSCSLDKRYHDQRKQNCFSAVPGVLYFFKRSRVKFFRCGDDGLSVPCWSMKIPRQISQTLGSHVMKNKF